MVRACNAHTLEANSFTLTRSVAASALRFSRESGQTARTHKIGGSVRTVAPLTSRGYSGDNANAFSLALQQQALNQQQREQEQMIQRQREAEQARLTATQPLVNNGSQSARPAPPSVDRNSGLHFSRRAPAPRRANPQLSKREQLMRAAPGYPAAAPSFSPASPSYAPHAPTLLPPVYSAAPAASSSSATAASIPPLNFSAARPATPVLHLDLEHALTLSARTLQEVGGSVWTNGLDPATKYRHPLTTSHRIGWNLEDPNKTLEFFGVNQHATRELSIKRLYGWQ